MGEVELLFFLVDFREVHCDFFFYYYYCNGQMECLKGLPFLIYMVGSLENLGKKQDNETFLGSLCLGFKMKKRKRKRILSRAWFKFVGYFLLLRIRYCCHVKFKSFPLYDACVLRF
jgi:hypothetical protein